MKNTQVTIQCAACGKDRQIPRCWLKRIKQPTCSRACNGVLRGRQWAAHGHKGRAAWTVESATAFPAKVSGENSGRWKGGVRLRSDGYIEVRIPEHPRAKSNGYVLQHLVVMEQMIGRRMKRGEVVHHIDHDRTNNEPANLKLYGSHKEHFRAEHLSAFVAAGHAAQRKDRSTDNTRPVI